MDFDMMGLSPNLIAKLAEQGIDQPTPIQAKAIPLAMEGRDVMGLAQTGTGKTAAFGLPLIHHLSKIGERPAPKSASGLILAPTRELAKQIATNLRAYAKGTHLKFGMIVGGVSMRPQVETMARGVDLLIATPGRLIDHLDRRTVRLDLTRHLVLDEADQMLDMGFIHALRRIAPLLPADRQTMLFSATMPKPMAEIANSYLNHPVRVEVARPGQTADKIDQSVHFVAKAEKGALLARLLKDHDGERALVFSRTKHGAERLSKQLSRAGFAAGAIHGNKSQGQRDRALAEFKSGSVMVLVATDVAARGIDVKGVEYVYNFDLPNVPESYVHRIGRTARAGKSGRAVAFCGEDEMGELKDIEKVLKKPIPVAGGSPWQMTEKAKPRSRQRRRSGPPRGGRRAAA